MELVSLLSLILLFVGVVISCGGGGGGGTTMWSTQQAAASMSAVQGAIALSGVVGAATQIASNAIPSGYAPGKVGSSADTTNIANLDPRLKAVVDKMVAQLQKPTVKNTISTAGLFKTVSSAPSPATVPCDSGSYTITDSIVTSGTSTTHNLSVIYNHCKDNTFFDELNGSITATHTIDSTNKTESAEVSANLTDTSYSDASFTAWNESAVLSGTFNSNVMGDTNSNGTGTNFANGSFTVLAAPGIGDIVMAFNFTNVNDGWVISTNGSGDKTETHTGNGSFSLDITMNASTQPQTLTLSIALTNLENRILDSGTSPYPEDMWINGSIAIGWSPDMSQLGCLNGTYNITTDDLTPIHSPDGFSCPTSGTLQVNNATIEFGKPSGSEITVTVDGIAEVFADCYSLGGGMCSIAPGQSGGATAGI
jgi:hypothetical protein